MHFFVDYNRSKGNFVVDADGNIMLDVFCQIASLGLGKQQCVEEGTAQFIRAQKYSLIPRSIRNGPGNENN